jgi:ataxia telangiectasia mutated family protein
MNNLKTVLHQLKSEKIKNRQEGLSSLRTVFGRDSIVQTLDEAGNGSAWLVVFQAIFTCVLNEKSTLTKSKKPASSSKNTSSATALRRLSDASATVRWLTERAVHRFNKKVIKSLLAHFLQTMVHQGELLMPVALDYIKAIRCIVAWTPHLEHLDEVSSCSES